jgi:hypothetical protein
MSDARKPSIWQQGSVVADNNKFNQPNTPAPPVSESALTGLQADIAALRNRKPMANRKDREPMPTLAERMLRFDEFGSLWCDALTKSEWALWKLARVFGLPAKRILNPAPDEDFDAPLETGLILFDACAGVVGKDIPLWILRLHWDGLLGVDQRTEQVKCGAYDVRRQRGYMRTSEMKFYIRGIVPLLELARSVSEDVEVLQQAIEGAHAKVYARANFKRQMVSPDPSPEQLDAKAVLQRLALDSDAMELIQVTVMEHEVVSTWIDCKWNGRTTAAKLGGKPRTIAKIIGGFTDRCATAWQASKKNGKPVKAFEAFTDTFIVDPDTKADDPDYEVALALTGKGGAFGDAYVQAHFHARSFDTWARMVYQPASDLEGVNGNRGHEGASESFWTVGSDDESDNQ